MVGNINLSSNQWVDYHKYFLNSLHKKNLKLLFEVFDLGRNRRFVFKLLNQKSSSKKSLLVRLVEIEDLSSNF